ncbi:hypothetical protein B0H17DRAFT_1180641 [Mycena rosella]|uniref:Uncharacterized protein n=1 Tax=Mycena rosella TaxID=1033263 RepID=A0AAD7DC28_MYCRO|nr:hypothetical protein B0H17DRAFT_1180641 [Mycena rosella]
MRAQKGVWMRPQRMGNEQDPKKRTSQPPASDSRSHSPPSPSPSPSPHSSDPPLSRAPSLPAHQPSPQSQSPAQPVPQAPSPRSQQLPPRTHPRCSPCACARPTSKVDVDADADGEDAALDAVLICGADTEEEEASGGIVLLLVLASLARGVDGDTGDAPGFSICVSVCAGFGFVVVDRVVTFAVRMRLAIVVPALDAIFFAGCGARTMDGGRRRERGGGSGAADMWRGVKTQGELVTVGAAVSATALSQRGERRATCGGASIRSPGPVLPNPASS